MKLIGTRGLIIIFRRVSGLENAFCGPYIFCTRRSQGVAALVSQIQITTVRRTGLSSLIPILTIPIWKGPLERNATVGDAKFNQGSLLDSGLQAVLDEPSNKYYITIGNSNSIHAEPYHFWIIFLRPEQIVFSFCLFLLFSPTYCVLK